ncbi:ribosomal protein L11 methyltransferase-like [Lolium rigidum]|uniref:ribosomal protein L11 methyltransferase-like n=1 Tax=Lolium rigidum TaxID=89674 RepID=UPI001F5DF1C5|nr:ribosomal protein L11 methyltransferase-like [Lolium rigidum]
MLPLVRVGRAPLRRLGRLLLASPQTLSLCSPNTTTGCGGGGISPHVLTLSARPSACRGGDGSPAARAPSGASSRGFCARAVSVDDQAPSSSADAAGGVYDLSAPYLSVRIRCRKEDADLLSESLLCFGACSVTVDDIAGAANLDEISITTIFAYGENVGLSVSSAASSAGLDYSPVYETSVGKQCDWVTLVQESYESTKVIDGLWIIPKWRTPPDPQATNIIINPGLAFGTGEHPTTKLCLLFLKEVIKGGERVLDYGTGTGVLSIAALKMGAALSTGIDIDPQAVASAHENRLLNGMDSNKMPVYLVPAGAKPSSFSSSIDKSEERKPSSDPELKSSKGTFDIVAANILLNPLLELVEDIVGYAKTGGTVAVSGILCEQVPKVEKAYSRYLDNVSVSEMDGWTCLQGTRKA